jgi:hypothetical protein
VTTYRADMPPAEKAAPTQEDTAMSEQITARVAETVARLRDAKRDWPEFGYDRTEAADLLEALAARLAEVEAMRAVDVRVNDKIADDVAVWKRRAEAAEAERDRLAAELAEARTVQGAAKVLLEAGADVHLGNAIQAQAMPDEVGGRQDREVFRLVANEALRALKGATP